MGPQKRKRPSAPKQVVEKSDQSGMVFGRENYRLMLVGLAVLVLGFVLMYGRTDDIFTSGEAVQNASFSFKTHLKITVAPLVVLCGFAIQVFAIMRRPRSSE